MNIALIILAAGKGTRMDSELPKVLHRLAGAQKLVHAMRAGRALEPQRTIIVAGHGFEAVSAAARAEDPEVEVVLQEAQLGTVMPLIKPAPHWVILMETSLCCTAIARLFNHALSKN